MRLSNLVSKCVGACVALGCMAATSSAYFIISEPTRNTQWTLGTPNPVTWVKGVGDGVNEFDVEMARLSDNGLSLIARNVPTASKSLNILLQDVPPGDDYFLIFINSTHGVTHATSARFTIAAAGSAASGKTQATPAPHVETVTVSGPPNPTLGFAVTFAALNNGVLARWAAPGQALGLGAVFVWCVLGAAWTLR